MSKANRETGLTTKESSIKTSPFTVVGEGNVTLIHLEDERIQAEGMHVNASILRFRYEDGTEGEAKYCGYLSEFSTAAALAARKLFEKPQIQKDLGPNLPERS